MEKKKMKGVIIPRDVNARAETNAGNRDER